MSKMKSSIFAALTVISLATLSAFMIVSCSSPNNQSIFNSDTGTHPANWYIDHRAAYLANPDQCTGCHGTDLHGGISGVSCFSSSFNGLACHATGPAGHPAGWASPDSHGAAAKSGPSTTAMTGFSTCQICHGSDFTGGLANQTCLNTAGCHGATVGAPHPPAPWRTSATTTRTHITTNTANGPVCGLCHLGGKLVGVYAPLPAGVQPGCFDGTLCHGSNVVPHPVPFTDPTLHGPVAKADLTFCEGCHANPSSGGPGSNPRFNVPIGNLPAGCESPGCHDPNYAHPSQWRGLTSTAPGGHMTAGNMANACALCHGVNLAGGVGPACSTCHTAGSPLTLTNCTSCHGIPPNGTAYPDSAGAHSVHYGLISAITPSTTDICNTCHNGGGTRTANHDYGRTSVFVSFLSAYSAKSGAASFDPTSNTCTNIACHDGLTTPNWQTGTINVNTQCSACHVLGTGAGLPENNSYFSGQHSLHVYGEASGAFTQPACTVCHDTTKLAAVHFTSFTAPISEATASATINSTINFNGTTCNPSAGGHTGCHSTHTW